MTIDDKTKVPLFSVVAAMPVIVGGILWLSSVDSKASDAKEQLTGVHAMLIDIVERLARIEQKVEDISQIKGK